LIDKGISTSLLTNPVYIGEAVHEGVSYPGRTHRPHRPQDLGQVQEQFRTNPRKRAGSTRAQTPSLLKGWISVPPVPQCRVAHPKERPALCYYVSQTVLKQGAQDCPIGRVPAAEIEKIVIDQIRRLLRSPESSCRLGGCAGRHSKGLSETDVRQRCWSSSRSGTSCFGEQTRIIQLLVERVDVGTGCVRKLSCGLTASHRSSARWPALGYAAERGMTSAAPALETRQRGRAHRCQFAYPFPPPTRRSERRSDARGFCTLVAFPRVDHSLLKAVVRAYRWREMPDELRVGRELAKAERVNDSYVSRIYALTLLAPEIIEAIVRGGSLSTLQLDDLLKPLPAVWGRAFRAFRLPVVGPATSSQLLCSGSSSARPVVGQKGG